MKAERSARLYLIEMFLRSQNSSLQARENIIKTISELAEDNVVDNFSSWKDPTDVLKGLFELNLVTENYGLRNYETDVWFLTRPLNSIGGFQRGCRNGSSPEEIVMFQIIVQALIDLSNGRPCDQGIWIKDLSSDFRCCNSVEHFCADDADQYLRSLEIDETLLGLQKGCIQDIAGRLKKKSPSLRISSAMSIIST
jgi:hypothetical protein